MGYSKFISYRNEVVPMDPRELSRDTLITACASIPDQVADLVIALAARAADLEAQVKELTRQLQQDSHNSSKPPSSDGPEKPAPKSRREKSGKASGGQPGHDGARLALRNDPDHIVVHTPTHCEQCGESLAHVPATASARRQVYDLVARMAVTEHQAETIACPACHHVTTEAFPDTVPFPVQYGPAVKTFLSYGATYQLVPSDRLCEWLFDLTGHQVSEGTLYNTQQMLYTQLEPFEKAVQQAVIASPVVNFDETGLHVLVQLYWLHSASTAKFTYYTIHPKRGRLAMEAAGILAGFTGTAVHDGWGPYWSYTLCRHALCNVHHERELIAVEENTQQAWARALITHLHTIKKAVAAAVAAGQTALSPEVLADYEATYDTIIRQGLSENPRHVATEGAPARGRMKQTKTRNLLERLNIHRDAVLLFMRDFRVPYTNNQAEQDVRMAKVRQKISGTFRSVQGAEIFCRIRSYISTLKKQGLPVFEYIQKAFQGDAFIPQAAP